MSAVGTDRKPAGAVVSAPFFLRGELVEGQDAVHRSRDLGVTFATPRIALDRVVYPRTEVPPLLNVPLAEIIDFLVETGQRIRDPGNLFVQECIDRMAATHVLPRGVLEAQVKGAAAYLDKRLLQTVVEQNFPDPRALDEWVPKQDFTGRKSFVRAFAPRLIHVLPGNSPGVAVKSIAQGAMVKAINLFKMSSSDPFTTVAVLRTMAEIDPGHAIVKSMSAVYWRGGDDTVERALYRPQYFDKIVAWGGGDAISNVVKYLGPGFQLVSFDPKTSISMVGREAVASDEALERAADLAATDVMVLNQEACVASRFIFLEADRDGADRFCERLHTGIVEKAAASGDTRPLDLDLREQIEMLMMLDDEFRVWGKTDGSGLVIRSDEPVDFHPINKIANVVRVDSLDDAGRYVNVATQTVGFYPFERMAGYRDLLASGGAQRIVRLGEAGPSTIGNPHDAMYPLHRFVHWMAHEDGVGPQRERLQRPGEKTPPSSGGMAPSLPAAAAGTVKGMPRENTDATTLNRTAPAADAPVVLDDVSKRYGRGRGAVTALDGVSLSFAAGSFTAVLGVSGSGKSTLLQCAAGLERSSSGAVRLCGKELSRLPLRKQAVLRRQRVGFVFQELNLLPELTVAENIALPLRLDRRPARRADIERAASRVGLSGDQLRRRPAQLSGGQQQRVAIARALITGPDVIFADEPTGALDPHTAAGVLRLLREAADGTTVVIVTHDPQVTRFCDQAVFLYAGRVDRVLPDPEPTMVAGLVAELGERAAGERG